MTIYKDNILAADKAEYQYVLLQASVKGVQNV